MKLATFSHHSRTVIGVVSEDRILEFSAPDLPNNMREFLALGESGMQRAKQVLEAGGAGLPITDVQLLAPVSNPGKFLAIALNYADHIEESGGNRPAHQTWFNKQITCSWEMWSGLRLRSLASSKTGWSKSLGLR